MAKREDHKSAKFDVNMSVATLAKLSREQAYWCAPGVNKDGKLTTYLWKDQLGFDVPQKVRFMLDYPFDHAFRKTVELARKVKFGEHEEEYVDRDIGTILWLAAKAYEEAFQEVEDGDNGAWHDIGDLVFEGMTIYDDGLVEFSVGS